MEIVDYRPDLAGAFKALNEAWITRFFRLEPKDEEVLADPEATIIAPGGHIVFVLEAGEAVGCCALMAMRDGGFEVAKMAVADTHQGRGLGRGLMAAGAASGSGTWSRPSRHPTPAPMWRWSCASSQPGNANRLNFRGGRATNCVPVRDKSSF